MKTACFMGQILLTAAAFVSGWSSTAQAEPTHWADAVAGWSGDIENYGVFAAAEDMTSATTWWLTGPPDADCNGNRFVHDEGDADTVAGWRSSGVAQFTLHFDAAIVDRPGNDLLVVGYGGTAGQFSAYASSDGVDFTLLGTGNGAGAGYLTDFWFDFAAAADNVHYIKIERAKSGANTGMFFDAIGGYSIPEPNAIILLATSICCAAVCWGVHRIRQAAARS